MTRPAPPDGYDDNPPLDAGFHARARPAAPGEAARLRRALEAIVEADAEGRPLDSEIAEAWRVLNEAS